MVRAKKSSKRVRKLWTPADVKRLRALAGRSKVSAIARTVRRSEPAIRFKAHELGISLAMK
jgi:hypothetical protein